MHDKSSLNATETKMTSNPIPITPNTTNTTNSVLNLLQYITASNVVYNKTLDCLMPRTTNSIILRWTLY